MKVSILEEYLAYFLSSDFLKNRSSECNSRYREPVDHVLGSPTDRYILSGYPYLGTYLFLSY